MRLVQGRQRHKGLQLLQQGSAHLHRPGIVRAAMHHPVTNADQGAAILLLAQEILQMLQRALVAQRYTFAPAFFRQHLPGHIFGNKMRRGEQAFDLATALLLQRLAGYGKQRKLDAGRACIQNNNDLHVLTIFRLV